MVLVNLSYLIDLSNCYFFSMIELIELIELIVFLYDVKIK